MLLTLGVLTVALGGVLFFPAGHIINERDKMLGCLFMIGTVLVIAAGFAMMVAYAIQQMPLL